MSSPTLTSICTVSSARPGWDSPRVANTHTHLLFSNYGSNYLGLGLLRQARPFLRVQRLGPLVVEMVCCSWAVATGDLNQHSWSRKSKISCGTHWISKISLIIPFHHDQKEASMLLRKHLWDHLRKVIYDPDPDSSITRRRRLGCVLHIWILCKHSVLFWNGPLARVFPGLHSASVTFQSSPPSFPVTNTSFSLKITAWLRHKSLYQAWVTNLVHFSRIV